MARSKRGGEGEREKIANQKGDPLPSIYYKNFLNAPDPSMSITLVEVFYHSETGCDRESQDNNSCAAGAKTMQLIPDRASIYIHIT